MKEREVLNNFIKYVSLNVLGMVGMSCYILADTFFVAKSLGANGLAALNFCISIFSIMQGLGLMIGIGGATRFSILKDKDENRNKVFSNALIFGLCIAILFVLMGLFLTEPLSKVLGADVDTLPLAKIYLKTLLLFAPFFIVNNILVAFVRNDENPSLSMIAMIISSLSNIVLDYVFMFPLSMGMFGAAFATGLSPIISICILSIHFIKKKNSFIFCKCRLELKRILDIFMLGASSFVAELASAIALITFNKVIFGIEGNIGVAAYGIIANVALVATAIFTGISQGIQPLASKLHGMGSTKQVKQVKKYALITAFSFAAIIYLVIYFMPEQIVSIFNSEKNPSLAKLATDGITIYFVGFFFAGVNIVTAAFMSAIDRAKNGMIVSLMRSCVLLVPMVLVLSKVFEINGVWSAFVVTEAIILIGHIVFDAVSQKFRTS